MEEEEGGVLAVSCCRWVQEVKWGLTRVGESLAAIEQKFRASNATEDR